VTDKDTVSVYVLHLAVPASKRQTLTLPSGVVKLGKVIKKAAVYKVPVGCLLGRYDGKTVKEWAYQFGSTDKLWQTGYYAFKGMQSIS
jgi:hypothetical protein